MSYSFLRRGMGLMAEPGVDNPTDPGPLCSDPNHIKEGAVCGQDLCKSGYTYDSYGNCVPIAKNLNIDSSSIAAKLCSDSGLIWDPDLGCMEAGTGIKIKDVVASAPVVTHDPSSTPVAIKTAPQKSVPMSSASTLGSTVSKSVLMIGAAGAFAVVALSLLAVSGD